MKLYKENLTKDDKIFLSHAKKHLRHDWGFVWAEAVEEYNKHSRESVAKREANFIILAHLKDIGQENWRNPKDESNSPMVARISGPQDDTLPKRNGKKWNGPSIIEMAESKSKGG